MTLLYAALLLTVILYNVEPEFIDKQFNITIKLEDNIYSLYIDDKWIASRDNCESILDELKNVMKKSMLTE